MRIIFEGLIVGLFVIVNLWVLTIMFLHGAIVVVLTWQTVIKEKTLEKPTWYYGDKWLGYIFNGNAFNIRKTSNLLKLYYKGE